MKINIEHNFTIQAAQKIVERCTPEVMRDMRFIVVDAGDGAYYFRTDNMRGLFNFMKWALNVCEDLGYPTFKISLASSPVLLKTGSAFYIHRDAHAFIMRSFNLEYGVELVPFGTGSLFAYPRNCIKGTDAYRSTWIGLRFRGIRSALWETLTETGWVGPLSKRYMEEQLRRKDKTLRSMSEQQVGAIEPDVNPWDDDEDEIVPTGLSQARALAVAWNLEEDLAQSEKPKKPERKCVTAKPKPKPTPKTQPKVCVVPQAQETQSVTGSNEETSRRLLNMTQMIVDLLRRERNLPIRVDMTMQVCIGSKSAKFEV